MKITVAIDMTVDEMQALLKSTQDINSWPMRSLRSVIEQSLGRAHSAYFSDEVVKG